MHRLREASIEWELDRIRERMVRSLEPLAPGLIATQMERAMSLIRAVPADPALVDAVQSELEALTVAYN